MKPNYRNVNSYFVLIFLLFIALTFLNMVRGQENTYTRAEFIADMVEKEVEEVVITPNREAPTGYATVVFENSVKELYATDVTELEALVREYGYEPIVEDIERDSWFFTYMLPLLIIFVIGIFFFMMMMFMLA